MTISGDNTVEVKDVLVGEVWICSGQSNMDFRMVSVRDSAKAIAESTDPAIRMYSVPLTTQKAPLTDTNSSWMKCEPAFVGNYSAVGYYFARDLRKSLNVPVGMINTSYGGTVLQAWVSMAGLQTNPIARQDMAAVAAMPEPPIWATGQNTPGGLYNGMIAPLIPYAIRGALWYQGESNIGGGYNYRSLFGTLIKNWRNDWGQGDFPFLFVQIAPFSYGATESEPGDSQAAELREAQRLTLLDCPRTAMAVITDVGDQNNIHPVDKEPVGHRLALAARAMCYGQKVTYKGPSYRSMVVKDCSIVLSFDDAGKGLVAKGGEPTGFTIAGADGKFVKAQAVINGNKITVSSPRVAKPVAVRYGWAYSPIVNVFNSYDLPMSPFRTDTFKLTTQPEDTPYTKLQ